MQFYLLQIITFNKKKKKTRQQHQQKSLLQQNKSLYSNEQNPIQLENNIMPRKMIKQKP